MTNTTTTTDKVEMIHAATVEQKFDPEIYCDCPKRPILGPSQDKCVGH